MKQQGKHSGADFFYQWIFLKAARGRLHKVYVADILYIRISGDILRFTVAENSKTASYYLFGSLTALLERLPEELFVRISHHDAINMLHLVDAEMQTHSLLMSDETILRCSREGWKELYAYLA